MCVCVCVCVSLQVPIVLPTQQTVHEGGDCAPATITLVKLNKAFVCPWEKRLLASCFSVPLQTPRKNTQVG